MTLPSLVPPPSAYVFIYSDLSLPLFPALSSSPRVYVYSDMSPSFSLHLSPLFLSLCTHVSSFCYKPCFHNNCDLSLSA